MCGMVVGPQTWLLTKVCACRAVGVESSLDEVSSLGHAHHGEARRGSQKLLLLRACGETLGAYRGRQDPGSLSDSWIGPSHPQAPNFGPLGRVVRS